MARTGKARSTERTTKAKAAAKVPKKAQSRKASRTAAVVPDSAADMLRRELRTLKVEVERRKAEEVLGASDHHAEALRQELLELKAELERDNIEADRSAVRDGVRSWLDPVEASDLRGFIAEHSEQVQQRKYQMSLIKDFIADPSRFGLTPGDVPTSTSFEEFAERRAELNYRIATVRTFLDLLTEELRQLDLAETYARQEREPQRTPPPRS